MRAAAAILLMMHHEGIWSVSDLAEIIDRETARPDLLAACEATARDGKTACDATGEAEWALGDWWAYSDTASKLRAAIADATKEPDAGNPPATD